MVLVLIIWLKYFVMHTHAYTRCTHTHENVLCRFRCVHDQKCASISQNKCKWFCCLLLYIISRCGLRYHVISLALGLLYDCLDVIEITLKVLGKIVSCTEPPWCAKDTNCVYNSWDELYLEVKEAPRMDRLKWSFVTALVPFTNRDWLRLWHGKVITLIIFCITQLLIHAPDSSC